MPYQLREDLSLCRVSNHLVFLDVQRDSYFLLPDALERALVAHIDGDEAENACITELVDRNILSESTAAPRGFTPVIESPSRSAIEEDPRSPRLHLQTYLEVLATVCYTKLQLRTRNLKDILDGFVAYREEKLSRSHGRGATHSTEESLLTAVRTFRHTRLHVPIETSCLLDSLAIARYLSRRTFRTSIVFGVALDPFSAHCWVQAGELALNETVGDANSHTPIRVI